MSDNKISLNTIVSKVSKQTAAEVVLELKKKGMMKKNNHTAFEKTEQLLYNYKNFKNAITLKEEEIEIIKKHGLPERSKSIVILTGNTGINTDTPFEKAEEKINAISESILVTKRFISIIDNALMKIQGDYYYRLIELKYFEGKTHEEIAEVYDKDVSTITRNKNKLINMLKITLFSDDVIHEIYS
jgi:DNA-directed RNA polymerase specialized sigma subunit